jgi:phospholipase/carboxylesterase
MTLDFNERPAEGDPEGALVLFHGRGADEHDLVPLLDALDPERRLRALTPRGPLSLPPGGRHWYVVAQVGFPDPNTFWPTFHQAAEWLDTLPIERTVLGGFSQGAVMAYALGLAPGRRRPAAIVAFSGFIPTVDGFEPDLERPLPPIAIGHGIFDNVIPVDFARRARRVLADAGAHLLYRESPLPHALDPRFVGELVPWVRAATIATAAVQPNPPAT